MDDTGFFPGSIQLAWLVGAVQASSDQLGLLGNEKSAMWLLKMIPVVAPIDLDPQLRIHRTTD